MSITDRGMTKTTWIYPGHPGLAWEVAAMRRRAVTHLAGDSSPLRRARLARNWTLEDVVAQMDARAASGDSGVTASMVSGWERGRHTTSIAHRKTLCAVYGQAPEVLFADQDEMPNVRVAPRLLATSAELHKEMLATVVGARECLVVTGSRSRDIGYLTAIERALAARPSLACYRVLFGPPHHQTLKDHLVRLLELRDPEDRSLGVKTLNIGLIGDTERFPERFFVASERMAVVVIPSLTSHEGFDSGVVLGAAAAARLVDHGRQAYAAAVKVETIEHASKLDVLRWNRSSGGAP
jgi:transcriptional regulator with XRE-family HTH domain